MSSALDQFGRSLGDRQPCALRERSDSEVRTPPSRRDARRRGVAVDVSSGRGEWCSRLPRWLS